MLSCFWADNISLAKIKVSPSLFRLLPHQSLLCGYDKNIFTLKMNIFPSPILPVCDSLMIVLSDFLYI